MAWHGDGYGVQIIFQTVSTGIDRYSELAIDCCRLSSEYTMSTLSTTVVAAYKVDVKSGLEVTYKDLTKTEAVASSHHRDRV